MNSALEHVTRCHPHFIVYHFCCCLFLHLFSLCFAWPFIFISFRSFVWHYISLYCCTCCVCVCLYVTWNSHNFVIVMSSFGLELCLIFFRCYSKTVAIYKITCLICLLLLLLLFSYVMRNCLLCAITVCKLLTVFFFVEHSFVKSEKKDKQILHHQKLFENYTCVNYTLNVLRKKQNWINKSIYFTVSHILLNV